MDRRLKRLKEDEQGLEGLPLQLLIIAVVLSIGLPIVYTSIRHYDTQRVLHEMEDKATFIGEKAKQLQLHGEGNSDVVSFELRGGIFRNVKYLELANTTFRSRLRWEISGGQGGSHLIENEVPLVSDNAPLRLGEGQHELIMECKFGVPQGMDQEILYIEVSRT